MESNELGRICKSFASCCSKFEIEYEPVIISLEKPINKLKDISLKKDYKLMAITPGCNGTGAVSTIYASDRLGRKCPHTKLLDYVDVKLSEKGIWSAYLISEMWRMLPLFWHANMEYRQYIVDLDKLAKICDLPADNERIVILSQDRSLLPSVQLINDNKAEIHCSYWEEFGGLFKTKILVSINGRNMSFRQYKKNTECLIHNTPTYCY